MMCQEDNSPHFSVVTEINFCNDTKTFTLVSEIMAVNSSIWIKKKTDNGNTGISHHAEKLIQRIFNLVDILIFTGLWFIYGGIL